MLFDVRLIQRSGRNVVSVVGEVDLATMPEVTQIAAQVDQGDVVLDLSGVDHLDPLTLGVVLTMAMRARRRSAEFSVVSPAGRPRQLLAESKLDTIVRVVDHEDYL